MSKAVPDGFYARPVVEVARDLVGCLVRHHDTMGRIVETEAYHFTEPACHAHAGVTQRTRVLHGPPGVAYVYRSYGIHALFNAVCEQEGVGAAVLIRALEPLEGLGLMAEHPCRATRRELCNGPGKLTHATGIGLDLDGSPLDGPIEILSPCRGDAPPDVVIGERIGITKAVELPWRFCDARSDCVSSPRPPAMRRGRPLAA
ncbi:MAG: DNA-3-methyladenine glycosylase [Thermoleophilaceae bacterium]